MHTRVSPKKGFVDSGGLEHKLSSRLLNPVQPLALQGHTQTFLLPNLPNLSYKSASLYRFFQPCS